MTTRCRFAPSPTGLLHVGGARTALFNLLYARATGGKFVLRIEDTDQARSTQASEDSIVEALTWLGLTWDEGPLRGGPGAPYRQSERLEIYREHARQLVARGLAYEAWETPQELEAERAAATAAKQSFVYRQRRYTDEQLARFRAEGRQPVLRFKIYPDDVIIADDILGDIEVGYAEIEDLVILKADGFPTYHFAVVLDDHYMGVTQVLRAQEHLKNTARHLNLYRAFDWEPPRHGHMPLIYSMSGGKMSKRDKAKAARAALRESGQTDAEIAAALGFDEQDVFRFRKKKSDDMGLTLALAAHLKIQLPEIDVIDFRRSGYLPEALRNYLALLGWSPGDDREVMTLREMTEAFQVNQIGASKARFDSTKLKWMNGLYIRSSSIERLEEAVSDFIGLNEDSPLAGLEPEALRALIGMYQERVSTIPEIAEAGAFFFQAPTAWGPPKAMKKHMLRGERAGVRALARALAALEDQEDWSVAGLEASLNALADAEYEGRMGKLAQPLRVAVSGGPVSPPIYDTLAWLGRDEVIARCQACLAHFERLTP